MTRTRQTQLGSIASIGRIGGLAGLVTILALALAAFPAQAADNRGTGDIAGVDADLDDSNIVTLNTSTLALVKRAFLADGTPVTSGSNLPRGTVVKFMIYVNNNTAVPVSDVSVRDVLDPAFAYQAASIKVDNSVANCAAVACTPAEEAAIFAAADASAALTDGVDADVASIAGATLDVGNANVANGQADMTANRAWAVLFSVRMQ